VDTLDTFTDHVRRVLLADPELREIARAHAWCEHGAQSLRIEGGRLVGIPDGWPRCIADPDRYFAERVDASLYQPKET
jgi:hypothetical protein